MEKKEIKFSGIIRSKGSKEITKSTGAIYVLQTVEITEGPLKGMKVPAERTLLNSMQEEKQPLEVGQECIVYYQEVESNTEPGKKIPFFTISEGFAYNAEEVTSKMEEFMSQLSL